MLLIEGSKFKEFLKRYIVAVCMRRSLDVFA